MKHNLLIVLAMVVFFSCKEEQKSNYIEKENIQLEPFKIDLVKIDLPTFSEDGFFRIEGKNIYYFDPVFSTSYRIDQEGKVLETYLGKGDGPTEIRQVFAWHSFFDSGKSIFLGRQSDIHFFDSDFNRVEDFMYSKNRTQHLYTSARQYNEGMYNLDIIYGKANNSSNTLTFTGDSILFVPVRILERVNPTLNIYAKKYYTESNVLGVINTNSGQFERVFGNWPIEYSKRLLPHYDNKFTTLKHDSVLVSYNASPRIQVYSPYPELRLIYEFGVSSKKMNDTYRDFISNEETPLASEKSGFYGHVYFDSEDDLVFRSYVNNRLEATGGIQVYKNGVLIGDVSTPYRFNIIGKIGDYYYADGLLDEENEAIGVFKFTINE